MFCGGGVRDYKTEMYEAVIMILSALGICNLICRMYVDGLFSGNGMAIRK